MGVMHSVAGYTVFILLAAAALCSFPNGAGAEEVTLRLHNFNLPKAIANRLFMCRPLCPTYSTVGSSAPVLQSRSTSRSAISPARAL